MPVLRAGGGGHPGAARLVRRRSPLRLAAPAAQRRPPERQIAAEATEAAGAQGNFWDMHDRLLTHQDELTGPDLRRHAEELGLDVDRFWEEVQRRDYADRVADDVATADASGVAGTPGFFINGRRHRGAYDVDTLSAAVKAARTSALARERGR